MRYIKIKNADKILEKSKYYVKEPEKNKNNWKEVFGNNNPIHIELGMGRGNFIIGMAKAYPKINFIGLDFYNSQMVSAVNKLEGTNLPNLKLIHLNALDLATVFGKEIDTIYITFPDPWPKKQDEKRRFTHEGYLRIYDRIFKNKKHIILKTDNSLFFAHSVESLSKYWYVFKKVSLDLHHDEDNIPNVMTDFEKVYLEEGRPIYYLDAYFEG